MNIEFEDLAKLVQKSSSAVTPVASLGSASLWVDYVYLDAEERRRFAQVSHEYLEKTAKRSQRVEKRPTYVKIRINICKNKLVEYPQTLVWG